MNNTRHLWAPWRLAYIRSHKKTKGCLFCRMARAKKAHADLVFLRSRDSLAMLNLYPYNNGHAMVAPKRHARSIVLLEPREIADLMNLVTRVMKRLDRVLAPEGYNIGMNIGRAAGAGIDRHLHVHIVPRWKGDTNFMPTLTDTKVISQSLEELHAQLLRPRP
jgi:ATP adenylyltransferase